MTTLFPLDQEQNDKLLLQEAQRKQDLIDFATRRFAPHLVDKPDVRLINLYSTNASLRKEIRALCGDRIICVEHVVAATGRKDRNEMVQEGMYLDLPQSADLVATKSALNTKVEWLAARLGALPIVLPEATNYLMALLEKKHVLTIVGGEQSRS
ncbi:hypothetical protein DQP57_00200 [Mycobacterium colombiense]|uniref:Uncharacterized protein n=1 Tax=Mycobacterium colombiense TaxID=339268 RepID=A0A329MFQ5_9MYCO|nr:hypothetical protein [Mycobacterium colombiense]RAV17483.1 hypothetical protein DQP57_00200 [Mycobacterium colombiense]